ncbi:SPOSA6832_02822 [Sporobolomyces salmonicolor]|uniref:DNA ligase n=1 Tax=Sporidiobolus salmonicolor TaxID=5005 RepID=A0A0D6EML6_SPOSA|nr:SPOSA6832_02822 [Sporobolomyces salmonicolor]
MAQDDLAMISQDEDHEMEIVKRPVNGNKKKRTIAIASSDVEDEDETVQPSASSSSPIVKKKPKVNDEEEKLKSSPMKKRESSAAPIPKSHASTPSSSRSPSKPAASFSVKAEVADKSKPPVSSFFAPRSTKAAAEKGKEKEEKDLKGKAKASDDVDLVERERDDLSSVGGGDDEEEDEDEAEEEAAGKMCDFLSYDLECYAAHDAFCAICSAEIFTMKARSSDKTQISWKSGDPVPYAALTATFDKIDATTKRLEISAYLTRFLVDVIEKTPGDLLMAVYLCINRLAPEYESLELGIGESLLMKAIGESCGRTLAQVKTEYKNIGDLGEVAHRSRERQSTLFKPKPLTVKHVFAELTKVAKTSGQQARFDRSTAKQSQTRKVNLIKGLLAACQGFETKYLIRSLEGKLRIGLAEKTATENNKSGKTISREKLSQQLEEGADIVKAVFSELPSYDLVVPALLEKGIHHVREACFLTPGVPLKPMLAKPTKAITEVLDRFEGKNFTCEYKYDGERAQIHYLEDGSVKVFSRNSEDMSVKYPDLVVQLPRCIKEGTESFVIDAEAVAWDTQEKRLLEFQKLATRKRKDVKAEDIKVKVHLFAFDMLYLNGEPLLDKNLLERRELLRKHLQPVEGEFAFATSEDASTVDEIQTFLDKSIKDGCEGLMVKMLEGEGSSYEPSRRSIHWLKLKKDYLQGVGDSFDLVVIGGDYGKGKRTNVYGAFHLACYDAESATYQAICKIGTGFSEEQLKQHWDTLHPLELSQKKAYYDMGTAKGPDVYFEPKIVWEVLAADLSLSPVYSAARGLCGDRGISLRFPRFLRIRDDKDAESSTEPEQIAEAYRKQGIFSAGQGGKKNGGAEDDFW